MKEPRSKLTVAAEIATVLGLIMAAFLGYRTLTAPGITVNTVAPSDPIEALSNRGYSWTQQDFVRAFSMGDDTSVNLFCTAGPTNVFTRSIGEMVDPTEATQDTPDRVADLKDCPAFRASSVCEDDTVLIALHERFNWDAFETLCGLRRTSELREEAQSAADAERAEAEAVCATFERMSDTDKAASSANFMLEWTAHRTWHRFGPAYSKAEFCEGVRDYKG